MKSLFIILFLIFALPIYSQAPFWDWVKQPTTPGSNGTAISTDNSGNVYTGGYCTGPFTFGDSTISSTGAYLMKTDAQGNVIWLKNLKGVGANILSIAVDPNNMVYIAGNIYNTSYLDSFTLVGTGTTDAFIAKCDSTGSVLWVKKCKGNDLDQVNSISLDGNGYPIVTGFFESDTLFFDTIHLTLDSINISRALFIAKFDPNGNALWAKSAKGNGTGSVSGLGIFQSLGVANDGSNLYITGRYNSPSLRFDTINLTCSDFGDAFLAKFDMNGNAVWAKKIGGTGDDKAGMISCDQSGNVIIGGTFNSSSIASGSLILTNPSSGYASFVIKYDPNGDPVWGHAYGRSEMYSIASGNNNTLYLSGNFVTNLAFGPYLLPVQGTSTMFVGSIDSSGNELWAKSVQSQPSSTIWNDVHTWSIDADLSNTIYFTGDLWGQYCYFDAIQITNPNANGYGHHMYLGKIDLQSIGLANTLEEKTLGVYPNPSNGNFFIEMDGVEKANVMVFDLNAKLMFSKYIKGNTNIDLSNLPNGIYSVTINLSDRSTIKKLVILKD